MLSRGVKSGGFQDTPSSAVDAADGFEPEFATQYEVDQKSRFLNGRLIWNNTLFVMKYTDLQTKRTPPNLSIVSYQRHEILTFGHSFLPLKRRRQHPLAWLRRMCGAAAVAAVPAA